MFISRGDSVKQIIVHPLAKLVTKLQYVLWYDYEASDREITQPIFSIDQLMSFKDTSEDN